MRFVVVRFVLLFAVCMPAWAAVPSTAPTPGSEGAFRGGYAWDRAVGATYELATTETSYNVRPPAIRTGGRDAEDNPVVRKLTASYLVVDAVLTREGAWHLRIQAKYRLDMEGVGVGKPVYVSGTCRFGLTTNSCGQLLAEDSDCDAIQAGGAEPGLMIAGDGNPVAAQTRPLIVPAPAGAQTQPGMGLDESTKDGGFDVKRLQKDVAENVAETFAKMVLVPIPLGEPQSAYWCADYSLAGKAAYKELKDRVWSVARVADGVLELQGEMKRVTVDSASRSAINGVLSAHVWTVKQNVTFERAQRLVTGENIESSLITPRLRIVTVGAVKLVRAEPKK